MEDGKRFYLQATSAGAKLTGFQNFVCLAKHNFLDLLCPNKHIRCVIQTFT